MNTQNKSAALLFNPSVYIAGAPALGLGIAAILLAGLIGSAGNAHFDGVLDTHVGAHVTLWVFLLEGMVDWLCLGVVLLVLGRIISRTAFRTVDVLGTQALARWPTLLMSLALLPKAFQRFTNDLVAQLRAGQTPNINMGDACVFAVVVLALLVLLVWMVALMYKAFSVSCNVKGAKAIGTFIGGILLAEILSKICVVFIFQHAVTTSAAASESTNSPAAVISPANQPAEQVVELSAAGRDFVDLLAKKDFSTAEERFDATMKSALPEAKLRAVWEDLLTQAGPFQKQVRTRVEKQAGYDVALVTCQFEKKLLDVKVVYDPQKKIAGLWYLPGTPQ
jgi:hypothetical protein